jgi:hypothetical protein
MPTETFATQLSGYIKSGISLVSVETYEKKRCIREIEHIVKDINEKREKTDEYSIVTWSMARGWTQTNDNPIPNGDAVELAHLAIKQIENLNLPEFAVFVMKDFECLLKKLVNRE